MPALIWLLASMAKDSESSYKVLTDDKNDFLKKLLFPATAPNINDVYKIKSRLVDWLVFYDISTLVGYLMPNPVYIIIYICMCIYIYI